MKTCTAALLALEVLTVVAFLVSLQPAATGGAGRNPPAGALISRDAPKGASAGESTAAKTASRSTDWPVPPTAQCAVTVEPVRTFDILGSARLNGASGGYLLSDGNILFWGDGQEVTERAVSLLNPANGAIQTIWQAMDLNIRGFFLSPDRQLAWFVTENVSQPDVFFVIDIPRRRVWPSHRLYRPEELSLLKSALKDDRYYETLVGPDGRLLVEWYKPSLIANWWGKSPERWQMGAVQEEEKIFSRAILSSPEASFRRGDTRMALPVTFEVSKQARIGRESRPEPDANGRRHAPLDDGVCYSELRALSMPARGLKVQLFNRYFDPRTMRQCGAGNEFNVGKVRGWSSDSSSTCARFQGAYVERAKDGKLLHVLNHGIGVPEGAAVSGSLFAMSGISEEPVIARYVSLWDAPQGRLIAHLALPRQAVGYTSPSTILFSNDAKEVYCLTSYPEPMLYVWLLKPEWSALGR